MYGLTKREIAVLEGIKLYAAAHGISPSVGDLAVLCQMAKSNVGDVLKQLERKGVIRRGVGARNIMLAQGPTADQAWNAALDAAAKAVCDFCNAGVPYVMGDHVEGDRLHACLASNIYKLRRT